MSLSAARRVRVPPERASWPFSGLGPRRGSDGPLCRARPSMYPSALLLTDPKLPSSAARRVHAGAQPPALARGAQDDLDLHALLQDLRGARPEPGVLAARPEHRDVRLDNAVRRRRGVRHSEQRARGADDGAPRGGHGAATADDCAPPPTACAGASDSKPGCGARSWRPESARSAAARSAAARPWGVRRAARGGGGCGQADGVCSCSATHSGASKTFSSCSSSIYPHLLHT